VGLVLAGHCISLLVVAHCTDEYSIFQTDYAVGCFNLFETQLATAVAAAQRGTRFDEGAHILSIGNEETPLLTLRVAFGSKPHFSSELGITQCVNCKGTGYMLLNIPNLLLDSRVLFSPSHNYRPPF
jgi:hypothetical protein